MQQRGPTVAEGDDPCPKKPWTCIWQAEWGRLLLCIFGTRPTTEREEQLQLRLTSETYKGPLARGMSEPGNTPTNTNAGQNRGGRNSYPRGRGQGPVQRGNEGTTAGRRYDGARA